MYPPGDIIIVRDGGLNLPLEAASRPLVVGGCPLGTANTLYWLTGSQNIVSELGRSPATEMLAPIAASGGALFLCTATTTAGSVGTPDVTRVGTSTGTITYGSNLPNNGYRIRVRITTTGTLGAGRFQYALDGKNTTEATGWSPNYTIPSGGTFALPETGATAATPITLTFVPGGGAVYFEADDIHRADCVAPHYTTADLTAAFAVLLAQLGSTRPERIMFSGVNATASTAITLAAAVAGHLDDLFTAKRFARAVIDGGSMDTVANFRTAIASFTDDRVALVWDPITTSAGCRISSKLPFAGWSEPVVPAVNAIAERFARTELSESLMRVKSGALRGVMAIGNDEGANAQFTAEDRIITLRRHDNYAGFFATQSFIRSAPTSDFRTLEWGCVLDKICQIVHDNLTQWIGANLRALTDGTGYLAEEEAKRVEALVNDQLREQLLKPPNIEGENGHVSGVSYTVTRTNNYLSTGEIYGYATAVPMRPVEGLITTVALSTALPTGV
jgi:hypothetical protein